CLATFTPSSPPNTTLPPHHHFLASLGSFRILLAVVAAMFTADNLPDRR
ncbi:hypothetical protein JMJ77_0015186, partial [Colletotrichum scovillei]